jgi:predicted phage terminase large subunit-like protein
MEAVARGEVKELVICIPPGCGKSFFVSVLFQAWDWLHNPSHRTAVLSANIKPVQRDALYLRNLIQTSWYRRLDAIMVARARRAGVRRKPIQLTDDQNEKANFVTTSGGQRVCSTMTSVIVGERYDGMLIDDPVNPLLLQVGAASPDQVRGKLDESIRIYDELESRIEPGIGWRITIMQRVAEGDLAGELIRRGIRAVVLPMEGDPSAPTRHVKDMRAEGELLLPSRYDRAYCDKRKHSDRPDVVRRWLAQYMQKPEPMGGRQFAREWFTRPDRRYTLPPERLARTLTDITISVDCAFKGKKKNDRVAIFVAGRKGAEKYALDLKVDHMDIVATLAAFRDMCAKWPTARVKLIEGAANGPAVIGLCQKTIAGIIEVNPKGGKEARAAVSSVGFEAGDWWLPQSAPWVSELIEEHVGFAPGCDHDDIVDAVSQLAVRWDTEEETFAERVQRQFGR